MPTPATEHAWDFQPVLDLLKAEVGPQKEEYLEQLQATNTHTEDTYYAGQIACLIDLSEEPKEIEQTQRKEINTLGDFSRLWAQLGVEPDLPPPLVSPVEPVSEEQPSSADESHLSSPQENTEEIDNTASNDGNVHGALPSSPPENIEEVKTTTLNDGSTHQVHLSTTPGNTEEVSYTAPNESNVPPPTSGNATDGGQEGDDEFPSLTKGQKKKARKAAKRAAEEQRVHARMAAQDEEARQKEESHRIRLEQFKVRQRMEKEQSEALQGAATNSRALDLAPRQILARRRPNPKANERVPRVIAAPQEPQKHIPDMTGDSVHVNVEVHPLPPRPPPGPKTPSGLQKAQTVVQQIITTPAQTVTQQPNAPLFMFHAGPDALPHVSGAIPTATVQPQQPSNVHPALVPRTVQPVTPKTPTPVGVSIPSNHGYFPPQVDPRLVPQVVQPFASQIPISGAMMNPVYQVHHHTPTPVQLIPRTVQPVAPTPRTPVPASKGGLTIRPAIERHFLQLQQLLFMFPEDQKWLVSPMQLLNNKMSPGCGIHIFVDASNILIGFRDKLKNARTQMFDLSFDSLALLLERRRPVTRRVLAGSSRNGSLLPFVEAFITKAEEVGYENNVYEQVYKEKELTERQRFFQDVDRIGYKAAVALRSGGESSDSETGAAAVTPAAPSPMKWVEQGVDENLHLKMCQSILDADEPATMVLATGDGAAAEYSDGFLAHVERALKRGWTVELVSWKQQINGGYTKKKWQAKWGPKFKVIYLDDFVESLIET